MGFTGFDKATFPGICIPGNVLSCGGRRHLTVGANRYYSQNVAPTGPVPPGTEAFSQLYKYDDQLRVTAVDLIAETPPSKGVVSAQSYRYDTMSRRDRRTTTDGASWEYGYNSRGEVISAQKRIVGEALRGHTFSYDYDDIGNRKSPAGMESGGDEAGNGRVLGGERTFDWTAGPGCVY